MIFDASGDPIADSSWITSDTKWNNSASSQTLYAWWTPMVHSITVDLDYDE